MMPSNKNPFFNIYNDANDTIFALNKDLDIIYCNKQFSLRHINYKQKLSNKEKLESIVFDELHINEISNLFNPSNSGQLSFSQNKGAEKTTFFCQRIVLENTEPFCLVMEKLAVNPNTIINSKSLEDELIFKMLFTHMTESLVLYKVVKNKNYKVIDFEFVAVNKAYEESIGVTSNALKGKHLFKEFPNIDEHWKAVHLNAFEQQKLFTSTVFFAETGKYWELKAFPAGSNQIATLASDVSEQITYKKDIKEKSEQLSFTEEKLRAYNEHLKYTCELIKESELSYKTLFEQNNDAILILVNGKIKDCNNKALELMNCQPYELVGRSLISLSPPQNNDKNDLHFPEDNFCDRMLADEKYSIDWEIRRPDGKLVETNIQLSCYTLENTKHVYAIIKDLTKEKTYVEEIKENEYLLEQAQRTAKLGHWSFNLESGGNMEWSNEMKGILELENPTSFFDFFKTLVHPDDKIKIAPTFDYFTFIPNEFDLQFRIITPNNKIKFVHTKGEISTRRNINICRGIIQDITAIYQQENRILFESKINETLAHAGAELISPSLPIDNIVRTIFKACLELTSSETGFVSYNDPLSDKILIHFYDNSYLNGNKIYNNIYFIEREKYKTEGLYGYPINLIDFELNNSFNKTPLRSIGSTTPKIINNFMSFPSVINNVFTGQIVLINSPEGFTNQHNNAIKTLSNIYGLAIFRKRMEWELVAAKEKAEESDRLKSAFLANMSHEIRTPMNAIVGFSQLLTHVELNDEKKLEFGNLINNSCEDLLTIVNDIIDISKIEAGQLLIVPKPINLAMVLNEIYNLALNKAQLKDKSFPIHLENNLNINFEWIVDIVRFKQIFLNLIDNAIKFTQHGSVVIGCEITNKNWLSFFVRDTGIGIPHSELDNVFQSFRQVESTIDRNYGGTGLGLAISKSLVLQMGGSIKVESKENIGSEFRFDLPLRVPKNTNLEMLEISKTNFELNLKNKIILIVEDEVRNAKLLKFFLENSGAELIIAYNGVEAINKAKDSPPDLVLLDIKMPSMDGITLLKLLREMYPNLPIIAQTAYAMKEDEQRCLDEGCDAYISKPVKREELVELIRKFIK